MFVTNLWYFAIAGRELAKAKMTRLMLLGEPILLARDGAGGVFALRDICPHRGIPLSYGEFDGQEVECPYHGWRFNGQGGCTKIPSLVEGQDLDPTKIKVRTYPAVERQGLIWIWFGEKAPDHDPPQLPGVEGHHLAMVMGADFPCHVDHAVIGLMDPAHGPFVHQAWFWRTKRTIHAKAKKFGPIDKGFAMLRHKPSSNSLAYRILGGAPTTEISFRLPGIRIEHIEVGKQTVIGFTAVTPVSDKETRVTQIFFWTMGILNLIRPFFRPLARQFLEQDRQTVIRQQEGLKFDPNLMLIPDADTQARWYFRLKRDWTEAQEQGVPFVNRIEETTLRWRS